MRLMAKNEGAVNALHNVAEKTTGRNQNNIAINALQVLRELALDKARKYRWDPALSEAHEEYLSFLNTILKEGEV